MPQVWMPSLLGRSWDLVSLSQAMWERFMLIQQIQLDEYHLAPISSHRVPVSFDLLPSSINQALMAYQQEYRLEVLSLLHHSRLPLCYRHLLLLP